MTAPQKLRVFKGTVTRTGTVTGTRTGSGSVGFCVPVPVGVNFPVNFPVNLSLRSPITHLRATLRVSLAMQASWSGRACSTSASQRLGVIPFWVKGITPMHDSSNSLLPHHRLRAYGVAISLLEAVMAARIRDRKLRDEALRAAKSACLNIVEGAARPGAGDKSRSYASTSFQLKRGPMQSGSAVQT